MVRGLDVAPSSFPPVVPCSPKDPIATLAAWAEPESTKAHSDAMSKLAAQRLPRFVKFPATLIDHSPSKASGRALAGAPHAGPVLPRQSGQPRVRPRLCQEPYTVSLSEAA